MLIDLARNTTRFGKTVWDDPVYRQRIAQMAIEGDASRLWFAAFGAKARKGGASMAAALSFEASVSKNYGAELRHRRANLVEEILGSYSQLMRGSAHATNDGNLVYEILRCRGATIEMGTTEVNRNIIAERVLGLPREDQVKKLF
jgi:alkylation response protein AidB-like acyl-CoA dehydrogenase